MISLNGAITINRSAQEVFDFVADFENAPKWQGGVVEARKITPGPMRVGTQFRERVRIGLKRYDATCTITEFVSGRQVTFKAVAGPIDYDARFSFEPVGGTTKAAVSGTARMRGWWRIMEPLVAMDAKKSLAKELSLIKASVEESASGSVAAAHA